MLTKGNIKLRPFEERDIDYYYNCINREESMGMYGGFGMMSKGEIIKSFREGMFWGESKKYFIIEMDKKPIGEAVIHKAFNYQTSSLELAVCIEECEHRNRGVGRKVISLLVDYIFNYMPEINRIQAIIDTENTPSIKMFSACKFKHEGTLREMSYHHGEYRNSGIYSIIKNEWKT